MYTLEEVIDNRLYIHCPEEWQRKTMAQYAAYELNDIAWKIVTPDINNHNTYFVFERFKNGRCEMFYGHVDHIEEAQSIIHFDDFDRSTVIFNVDNFISFLMEG